MKCLWRSYVTSALGQVFALWSRRQNGPPRHISPNLPRPIAVHLVILFEPWWHILTTSSTLSFTYEEFRRFHFGFLTCIAEFSTPLNKKRQRTCESFTHVPNLRSTRFSVPYMAVQSPKDLWMWQIASTLIQSHVWHLLSRTLPWFRLRLIWGERPHRSSHS